MNPIFRYFNTMKYSRLCIYFFVILTGCRLGPTYHAPTVEIPETWKNEATECSPECPVFTGCWWSVFDDETLNCLEQSAITYNPSIAAALDRVAQARAIAGVDKAALYPQLNLTPSFTDQGILTKLYLPPGGFGFPISENLRKPFRIHQYRITMPLMMSYEVDFWGKIRGEYDSALFNAEAQLENYYTVMLTLTTDLASSYFQMRALDSQIDSLKRNIE
ncbi:MAG TPA: TolC family protein, partial [Parachlamydiaceae bacterium]|nr:TolC family protein [Parachlamydiaceae bacterium]